MSEKKARKDRKLELLTDEVDSQSVAEEMAKSIAKMYEDRDKKALNAKETLVSQLKVTVDKYRTANGVMSALQTVRDVIGADIDVKEAIAMAKSLATGMANVADLMAKRADELEPEAMRELCDGFYDAAFSEHDSSAIEMANELMILQLCQNVGPSAEDISDFLTRADEEIEKAREDLNAYCLDNGIDFDELCGPHDKCPDCLCMDCLNDCKQAKEMIEPGMSAYDVCQDFVAKG